jgi:peptidoglycan/LPS O-acetylase OafA/YrhL
LGLLITIIGFFIPQDRSGQYKDNIEAVFYFIGGLLIPGGAVVLINEFNLGVTSTAPLAMAFCFIFVFYLFTNYIKKNPMLTLFTIWNGTAFIYLTIHTMTNGLSYNYTNLYAYLTMVIGACYILLAYSFKDGWNSKLTSVLYLFGFIGIQLAVLFQYIGVGYNGSLWPVTLSLGLIFAFYLFINSNIKNTHVTLLTILNGTAFMYVFVGALIGGSYYQNKDLYSYLTMVIGAVYLLLAYSFKDGWNSKLVEVLNFLGIVGLLGAAFSQIYNSVPWLMFFFVLVIGGFMFSIYSRSRAILIISTCYLLAYISYITGKYFADSIGWPISLVILGFLFIGLGYFSINLNKKYISNS